MKYFRGLIPQAVNKTISSALISVYHKDGLEPLVRNMHRHGIVLYSTGGTQEFIEKLGIPVVPVEELTGYPSILGGRVKTLHPGVFGGILWRRGHDGDREQVEKYGIHPIDCVVVDLYPFEATVQSGSSHDEIIEMIDIGGVSLIRGAAKNFEDVVIIPSAAQYPMLGEILARPTPVTSSDERRMLAREAFDVTSHYDSRIYSWFPGGERGSLKISEQQCIPLRYGENPHQQGFFFGDLGALFDKLNGKELSYNNLLDVDAALGLIDEFLDAPPTFAILKHNNACGIATRSTVLEAYVDALAGDPVSAFGGILVSNTRITLEAAQRIHDLFCEVIIAPGYEAGAAELLAGKANRIILRRKETALPRYQVRTLLNGFITQDKDFRTESERDLRLVTRKAADGAGIADLVFANKLAKHTKSNTIVLVRNGQLCASGTGQTSRVDALRQAVDKARSFGFDLQGAVMASDAFFPFPDCVEIAHNAGITAVVQPGGSIKDQLSVDFCDAHGMAMYMTGVRHFRH